MFVKRLDNEGPLPRVTRVRAELLGSLGATGHGHSSPKAVLLGLERQVPATMDVRGRGAGPGAHPRKRPTAAVGHREGRRGRDRLHRGPRPGCIALQRC
ncbi:serine dehydratase beta chain [Streptomyces sp. NPDC052396]|uniref:serine dehydratase beta chain n=1 Tax=Streptomyces sp. NPDC052396 TaxID=3365689 RepID=UPI0037D540AC